MSKPHLFNFTDVLRIIKKVYFDEAANEKEAMNGCYIANYSSNALVNLIRQGTSGTKKRWFFSPQSYDDLREITNNEFYYTITALQTLTGQEYIRPATYPSVQKLIKRAFKYVEVEQAIESAKRAHRLGYESGRAELTESLLKYIVDRTLQAVEDIVMGKLTSEVVDLIEGPPDRKLLPAPKGE